MASPLKSAWTLFDFPWPVLSDKEFASPFLAARRNSKRSSNAFPAEPSRFTPIWCEVLCVFGRSSDLQRQERGTCPQSKLQFAGRSYPLLALLTSGIPDCFPANVPHRLTHGDHCARSIPGPEISARTGRAAPALDSAHVLDIAYNFVPTSAHR